tara:strand:- start:659 stop:1297 length:639 start_codon:yes stop_codon:yes gene_type:complete
MQGFYSGTPWGNMYGASLGYTYAPPPAPPQAPARGTTTLQKFLMQDGGHDPETKAERDGVSYGMRRAAEAGRGLAVVDHPVTKVASLAIPGASTARALAATGLTHEALDAMGKDYTVGEMAWDNVPFVGGSPQDRVLDRWGDVMRTVPNAPGAWAAGTTPESTWELEAALNEYMDQPHLRADEHDVGGPGAMTTAPPPEAWGNPGGWGYDFF